MQPGNLEQLATDGYTVVRGVLSADEAAASYGRFWDWLEALNPALNRAQPETWRGKNWPFSLHGIIQHYEIGHAPFIWDIRQHPRVVDVFAALWGTRELLVSFDGACFGLPHGGRVPEKTWDHVDQSPSRQPALGRDFTCIQGFINLRHCGPSDGGLVVRRGSHRRFAAFFADRGISRVAGDWYKFKPAELASFDGCECVKVCCEPGDVVLWDSRTVHYAMRPASTSQEHRVVVYLCMTPRALATPAALERKKGLFAARRTTNHWPHDPRPFPIRPRFGPKFAPPPDQLELSPLGRQLAGLDA